MNARWLGRTHRSYYVLSLTLLTLAACQDPPSDPEPGDLSPALATTSNTWQKRIRMPSDRRLVMTATVDAPAGGSFLYAVGGRSMNSTGYCSGSLSKVQAYDGNTNTWTTKAPLPAPAHRGLTGVINRKIYVAGGCRESTRLWEYDVATNQWTAKASAPLSLPGPVGSVVAGKLYVFDECSYDACLWDSGFPGREAYTFFGFYDPALDRWVRLPLPPMGVWPSAAATFNGKLYCLDSQGRVHIYTPATGAWTTGASRSHQELAWTNAVVRGKWYLVGANFLDVYDPATNTWAKRAAPPAAIDDLHGPSAGRVWAGGVARLEVVGGSRPDNNWQYTP